MITKWFGQRVLVLAATAVAAFMLQGCGSSKSGGPAAAQHEHEEESGTEAVTLTKGQAEIAAIEYGVAERKPVAVSVRATGSVVFNEKRLLCLTARVAGRIEELEAFTGERVGRGDLLFRLYSPEFQAAQAEYLQIAARLERASGAGDSEARNLAEKMLVSAAQRLQIIGFPPERLEAIRVTRIPDQLLSVVAPFPASVIESRIVKGDYVELGAELLTLADLGTVWILADVFEKDLAKVASGADSAVTVEAYPRETFPGKVTLIHDRLDEQARTVKVRIELSNPAHRLKPGMFAVAEIVPVAPEVLLVVPENAVRLLEGRQVVFVPDVKGGFEIRAVKTGRTPPGYVEILEGLEAGERVVTEGSFTLKSEILKKTFEGDEHGHD